jgi:YVTN family beta-propeller protein
MVDFRILGPLEVRANGDRLRLGGRKQRALLAVLLLNANEVVSRDRLIDVLWGEKPPPTAGHTLDAYLSRLRKALAGGGDGEVRLVTLAPGYLLRIAPGQLDLARFERLAADGRRALDAGEPEQAAAKLRQAEALWHGRPLADLEFEPFARAAVQRLEQLGVGNVEQRVEAELAIGRHELLVPELEALVAGHPLRERLRGQLMLALYRSGRQAEALSVYREGRVLLREELGLDPCPQLRELERAVLRQDPALDAPSARAPTGQGAAHGSPTTVRAKTAPRRRVALAGLAVAAALLVAVGLTQRLGVPRGTRATVAGNAVATVDIASGLTSAPIMLRARPAAAAYGAGSVWIATPDAAAVLRVDPASRAIGQTIAVGGGPDAVTVGAGAVWVANYLDGTISRIDPGTDGVVQTIGVGSGPSAVAVGNHLVWVANTLGSSVSRIAASTGAVLGTTPVGTRPAALAIGAGAVWVASESDNRVLRIDPATGGVQQAIPVGTGPAALTVSHGAVWVANRLDGTISRIDPRRDVVTDTIAVGDGPSDVAPVSHSLWVSNALAGTLTEVDSRALRVIRTLRLGGRPQALTAAGGSLFVGVAAAGAAHRGGTLTLLQQDPEFDSLDPATLISLTPTQLLGLTNDGLVTLNHAGGAAGLQVVPDLAVSLPAPADGGTTYSFKLRPDIRYSTGRLVEARDFRYALERVFQLGSPVTYLYRDIVGANACQARPRTCDLSNGIVTDEATRRVTFHLSAPDPDFLEKLALPYTYAVPYGSAPREAVRKPLPATGPYMIASYRPGHELMLVRNPRFHEWSTAAQPGGYPDAIVWKLGVRLDDALTAIQRGHADWVLNYGPLPPGRRRQITTQYASQAHTELVPLTYYYFMNTRVPPFNDVRVRRAVNYALDRTALARIYHARPACQVVPPQMPGYRPYCPYTVHPRANGAWSAPDLSTARRLIAASGTKGMQVKVINDLRAPDLSFIVALLRKLGYRASSWIAPGARRYGQTISDSRNRVQIGSGGWGTDYPAASNFFDAKFSCRVYRPANPSNNNDSEFCNRRIEAEADRARLLGLTNPPAANRAWERVYRDIVDQAPWLPTVTPTWTDFISKRVGNYRFHPLWGILIDQLWVR